MSTVDQGPTVWEAYCQRLAARQNLGKTSDTSIDVTHDDTTTSPTKRRKIDETKVKPEPFVNMAGSGAGAGAVETPRETFVGVKKKPKESTKRRKKPSKQEVPEEESTPK